MTKYTTVRFQLDSYDKKSQLLKELRKQLGPMDGSWRFESLMKGTLNLYLSDDKKCQKTLAWILLSYDDSDIKVL